jgi:hypothetical protein
MAITATRTRGLQGTLTLGDGTLSISAEVPYLITGATAGASLLDVLGATGLPAIGSLGQGGYVVGASADQWTDAQASGSGAWGVVRIQYGPWPGNTDPDQQDPNPLNRPASVRWGTAETSEAVDEDEDGKAPVNTLGDPIDPPPEESVHRPTITIQRFVEPDNALRLAIADYVNHVNSGAFWGKAQDVVLCRSIDEEERWEGQDEEGKPVHCVSQTIVFEIDEAKKWRRRSVNRGGRYKNGNGKIVVVTDENGVATGEVVLLNENGTRYVAGVNEPHFVELRTKPRANFSDLDLPNLS